ncbi:hypothetical protein LJC22_00670 [Desulfosarcina sp. OttesenSCG-928-G10]|nr:hypothetical protein [Desulfosarcina sp. OttesenSCG-928-G10]MDL2320931.1 hypothetical protein [Desulfosarcina sp. OttesenSCG-928-B08]
MNRKKIESALGFFWEPTPIFLPQEEKPGEALFVFQKNMAGMVWNALGVFENNPSTLPQTETILQGQSVSGISIDHLLQVKQFADGARFLITAIKHKTFALDIAFAAQLHARVGKEEALEWGISQNRQVHIRGASHVPPAADALPQLAEKGFFFLREQVKDSVERAVAVFLFMSRSPFFFDCNKRTASLMMNGALLSEGYYPITVLRESAEAFNEKLSGFYNTGDATPMMRYFVAVSSTLYKEQTKKLTD